MILIYALTVVFWEPPLRPTLPLSGAGAVTAASLRGSGGGRGGEGLGARELGPFLLDVG